MKIIHLLLLLLIPCFLISQSFIVDVCETECVYEDATISGKFLEPSGQGQYYICDYLFGESTVQIFTFEASNPVYSIGFNFPAGVNQVKVAVIENCGTTAVNCFTVEDCVDPSTINISNDGLCPGTTVSVYVDVCNYTGSYPVDFDMNLDLSGEGLFQCLNSLSLYGEGCESSQNIYCPDQPLYIEMEFFDEILWEYYYNLSALWVFNIEGPQNKTIQVDNLFSPIYLDLPPGDYVMRPDFVIFSCEESLFEEGYAYEFTIGEQELFEDISVCSHDLEDGYIPESNLFFELELLEDLRPIYEEGVHVIPAVNICGCQVNVNLEIFEVREEEELVEIVICPEDYPYEYEGYDFDYIPGGYTEVIILEEESDNTGSDNIRCNRLVRLDFIDEATCAACDLPMILIDETDLFLCMPFDEGPYDVSKDRNEVSAENVRYQRTTYRERYKREAVFDGNNDYLFIKDNFDLNEHVFTINFLFNKDDDFENGSVETLVSKGDLAQDDLRFSIDLIDEGSKMTLQGSFYGETVTYDLAAPDLNKEQWYEVVFVVGEKVMELHVDGVLVDELAKTENLRRNNDRMYIGTQLNNSNRRQFYHGIMDEFKMWNQPLGDLEVTYLFFPEKEFEEEIEFVMSCCETQDFNGEELSYFNPIISIVVPEASPTNYDSTYIAKFVKADEGPEIVDYSVLPSDQSDTYQKQCNETCSKSFTWTDPPMTAFSDNCNIVDYTSTHSSPLTLDENESFVEVVYTITDNCGNENSFSFSLELECVESDIPEIPNETRMEITDVNNCDSDGDNIFCSSDGFSITTFYLDNNQETEFSANRNGALNFGYTVNGTPFSWDLDPNNQEEFKLDPLDDGMYEICLEDITNDCETKQVEICETIEIRSRTSLDYGRIEVCGDDIDALIPEDISDALLAQINSAKEFKSYREVTSDNCGCELEEEIEFVQLTSEIPEQLNLELCEGETVEVFGEVVVLEVGENEKLLLSEGGSALADSQGNHCDSLVQLSVTVVAEKTESVDHEICEGESYQGYNASGTYNDVYTTAFGCDSTRILNLLVLENSYTEVYVELCPGDEYEGHSDDGIFTSIFPNAAGCDSLHTIEIVVLDVNHPNCASTSTAVKLLEKLTVYPNPVNDILYVKGADGIVGNLKIIISNINGQQMHISQYEKAGISVQNLVEGLYFVQLVSEDSLERVSFSFLKM